MLQMMVLFRLKSLTLDGYIAVTFALWETC